MQRFHDIKAIIFDAVGTVMYPCPSVPATYHAAIKQYCHVDANIQTISDVLKTSLRGRSLGSDLTTNEAAEQEFWANLIHQLCPDSAGFQACFDHLFHHFGQPAAWRCFDDVPQAFEDLRKFNVEIGIASNFDCRLNTVCDGLAPLCETRIRVISSLVGFRKPAREFYTAVLEVLQLPAANVLMVGDDALNDVQGAIDAGLSAVLIDRHRTSPPIDPPAVVISSLSELPALIDGA